MQNIYNAWVKGCFYAITIYACNKKTAKEIIKEKYGKYPYHIEQITN